MLGLTAAKNGIAISARNVGFAAVRRMVSVRPFALMPLTDARLPLVAGVGAHDVVHERDRRRGLLGSAARSKARLKAAAVTAEPSLNRSPLLSVKVYVLPSLETRGNPTAASGTSREPSGAGLSG